MRTPTPGLMIAVVQSWRRDRWLVASLLLLLLSLLLLSLLLLLLDLLVQLLVRPWRAKIARCLHLSLASGEREVGGRRPGFSFRSFGGRRPRRQDDPVNN